MIVTEYFSPKILEIRLKDAHLQCQSGCNDGSELRANLYKSAREMYSVIRTGQFLSVGNRWNGSGKKGASSMTSSKTPFRPTRMETRADITDRAAREIIDAQATARNQQIARLRSLRLQSQSVKQAALKAQPAPTSRKKAR